MKKRILSFLLVTVMAAGLMMGCNSSGETEKTETTEETTAGAEASGKKVTALFFTLEGEFFYCF